MIKDQQVKYLKKMLKKGIQNDIITYISYEFQKEE